MTQLHVHNPGPDAFVFRSDGRVLPPFKTATADADDKLTQQLIRHGRLIDCTPSPIQVQTHVKDESQHVQIPSPEIPVVPAEDATKAAWVDYAKSQGATDKDLKGLTRDQIRDRYTDPSTDETEATAGEPETPTTAEEK